MSDEKNKNLKTYYKLWCGHIQLTKVEGTVAGQSRIYCRQCKDHSTIVKKSPSRWEWYGTYASSEKGSRKSTQW